MLDLGLSSEQEELQRAVRSLLGRLCDAEVVRASEPLGFDANVWGNLRELGVVDMAVPEAAGGAGATLLDVALVCEEVGAALAPVPLVESIVSARLLARLGGVGAGELLNSVLAGSSMATLALTAADATGEVRWVPWGALADQVLVLDGQRLVVGGGAAPGQNIPNLGSLPVADRTIWPSDAVLAEGDTALRAVEAAWQEWKVLMAAQLCGAGRRALEIGVAYTKERHQFGVPIASFQAVAHRIADAVTAMDGAQLLARRAAWGIDAEDSSSAFVPMSFAYASEVAQAGVDAALHFHGGYGFMLEYDVQLYFRRIKAWTLLAGDHDAEFGRVADALWGAPARRQAS